MKTVLVTWSPEQWLFVISGTIGAVAAAISSVISALQNKNHAAQVQANHAETMSALKGPVG